MDDVFGLDTCEHEEGGEWVVGGMEDAFYSDITLSATLRCTQCLRTHITSVPIHAMPEAFGVPIRRREEDEYVRLWKATDILRGVEPCESLGELKSRDEVVDNIDPTNWAVRPEEPDRPQRRRLRSR